LRPTCVCVQTFNIGVLTPSQTPQKPLKSRRFNPDAMTAASPLIDLPPDLLEDLDDETVAGVCSDDAATAAATMLAVAESVPPFSSQVQERSRWLAYARQLIAGHSLDTPGLDVQLLALIAQTALAARETTPALTASDQALAAAVDMGDVALEAAIRARRLPHLAMLGLPQAEQDAARNDAIVQSFGSDLPHSLLAEINLGRVAWCGTQGQLDELRKSLAGLARLQLPADDRLTFIAYATQCALAQLSLRSRQRVQAVRAMIEAARLADEMQAYAELANLQAGLAAFAVRIGDFDAALAHADSSLLAASRATNTSAQPDPWLGLPLDVSIEDECGGVIRVLAEGAVAALDRGDRLAFLVLVTALVAFYIQADRAPEALDALREAIEAAETSGDDRGADMLRGVTERLLRYMGMLS